jgi:hypothetical protein
MCKVSPKNHNRYEYRLVGRQRVGSECKSFNPQSNLKTLRRISVLKRYIKLVTIFYAYSPNLKALVSISEELVVFAPRGKGCVGIVSLKEVGDRLVCFLVTDQANRVSQALEDGVGL